MGGKGRVGSLGPGCRLFLQGLLSWTRTGMCNGGALLLRTSLNLCVMFNTVFFKMLKIKVKE